MNFFDLLKNNALICSILINRHLTAVGVEGLNTVRLSDRSMVIEHFPMGGHVFERALFALHGLFVELHFTTKDATFFEMPETYFGRTPPKLYNAAPGATFAEKQCKELGYFDGIGFDGTFMVWIYRADQTHEVRIRYYFEKPDPKQLSQKIFTLKGEIVGTQILQLFRPEEMSLLPTFTPNSYDPVFEIRANDVRHPVIRYLETGAGLLYEGQLYGHGQIPRILPGSLQGLLFHEKWAKENPAPVLEIHTADWGDSHTGLKAIPFQVEQPVAKFVKLDDRLFEADQLAVSKPDWEKDHLFVKVLFGKAAVDELGDPRYCEGVRVYRSRK